VEIKLGNTIMLFFIKIVVGGFLIALVSELSKRYETLGTMMLSLPTITIITFLFIYVEQRDLKKISNMSHEMIYMLVPSVAFFLLLPFLLTKLENFWIALIISSLVTAAFYYVMMKFLGGAS